MYKHFFSVILSVLLTCPVLLSTNSAMAGTTTASKGNDKVFTMSLEELSGKFAHQIQQATEKRQADKSKLGKKQKEHVQILFENIQKKVKSTIGDAQIKFDKNAKQFIITNNTNYDNNALKGKLKTCIEQSMRRYDELKQSGLKGTELRKQWGIEMSK